MATGRELDGLSLAELREICPQFDEDVFAAITLEATLDCHDVVGGTARERVRTALAEARERLRLAREGREWAVMEVERVG